MRLWNFNALFHQQGCPHEQARIDEGINLIVRGMMDSNLQQYNLQGVVHLYPYPHRYKHALPCTSSLFCSWVHLNVCTAKLWDQCWQQKLWAVPESGAAAHPPFAGRGGGGLCTAPSPSSPSPSLPMAAPRLRTKTDGFIQTEKRTH